MKKKIIILLALFFSFFLFIIITITIAIGMLVSSKDSKKTLGDEIIYFDIEGEYSGADITYKLKYDGITIENIKGKIDGKHLSGSQKQGGKQAFSLPDPPASKDVQSFMAYTAVTSTASAQYKVLNAPGVKDVGIYRKKGNGYFVALGTYYGVKKGTEYELHFKQENGSKKVITAYLGDTKSDAETDTFHQYHLHDKSIVEFITAKGTDGENINKTQSQINKDFGTLTAIYLKGNVNIDFSGTIKGSRFTIKGTYDGKELVANGRISNGKLQGSGTIGRINKKGHKGKFGFPLSGNNWTMTSPFGPRPEFVLAPFHTGVDYGAPEGTPILSAGDGIVVEARPNEYGLGVKIDHQNGYFTVYGHMSKITTTSGKYVKKGEKIGEVGATGLATGNHLHFEVRKGKNDMSNVIDPVPLLEGQR